MGESRAPGALLRAYAAGIDSAHEGRDQGKSQASSSGTREAFPQGSPFASG